MYSYRDIYQGLNIEPAHMHSTMSSYRDIYQGLNIELHSGIAQCIATETSTRG